MQPRCLLLQLLVNICARKQIENRPINNQTAFNEGGLGPHWWNVPLKDFIDPAFTAVRPTALCAPTVHQLTCNLQRLFTLQIVNNWATMFAKLSILYFLLRLFPRTARKTLSVFIYLGIGLNIVYTIILTLYLGIQCGPRPDGHGQFPASCGGPVRDEVGWASAALGIFLDLYVLAISIPTIANLQMSAKRKIGVIVVLATGLLYVEFSPIFENFCPRYLSC